MTAFWSAMVRNCMRQIQAKNSEKLNLMQYQNSLKERIQLAQENQNSIWEQNVEAASASYLAASDSIQQRIAQIQADSSLDQTSKNTQIQQLQAELQSKKTQADMEMQQLKRMWDQQQREQLKPLQQEDERIDRKNFDIDTDVKRLEGQKQYCEKQCEKSDKEFYGAGNA